MVHCPTRKYNMRVRAGRGFTLEELRVRVAKGGGTCAAPEDFFLRLFVLGMCGEMILLTLNTFCEKF